MAFAVPHPLNTAQDPFVFLKRSIPDKGKEKNGSKNGNGHGGVSKILENLSKHKIVKNILPELANACSIGGNALSALANFFGLSETAKKVSDFLAKLGTKFFLYVNSLVNTIEQVLRGNYLSAVGYFLDSVIATVVPENDIFRARGFSSGSYHL